MKKNLLAVFFSFCFSFICGNAFAEKCADFTIEELALKLGNHSLLVYKDGNITFQDEKGIQPLLIQIKNKGLKNAIVIDKIVGKAAALLMVYGKVKQVHTNIIAKDAIKVFEKYKIEYSYMELVDHIQNMKKDGLCPMEQKVLNTDSPRKAYKIFAK
ncbi:MAG: DUF1893 domain-containing protein [Endomicrobiaceae bacterium]|nr:DUF1893 domain-containing protein [Endomicrobiaceae bacterium]